MTDTQIAIVLYPGFTALDVVGPYQMLALAPGVDVRFVAESPGPVADDCDRLTLTVESWHGLRPDVVLVPGGPGTVRALDGPIPAWLRQIHPTTRWTGSVCSGALILAAAGLLDGVRATTHYRYREVLGRLGALPVDARVVMDQEARTITSAGVSAGIDMALGLLAELTDRQTAEAIQLWTEYDPAPPFDAGSPDRADAEVVARAAALDDAAVAAFSSR